MEEENPVNLQPPPLPPRIRNRDSTSSDIFMTRSRSPPTVPPRAAPPPVPPRGDSMYGTLPRSQSASRNSAGHINISANATLPRCSAERDTMSRPPIPFLNYNGDDNSNNPDNTPRPPPRTYRHTRQQSS